MPLITAPVSEPVTLDEAKLHLRLDDDQHDHDALIAVLIKTARQQAEHRTGRRFGEQVRERAYNAFPSWSILLPDPPVTAIVSIKYDDLQGVERTLDPAAYVLRPASEPAAILPVTSWPATIAYPGAVRVRFSCGLQDTDERWESLKAWILLAVGCWFSDPERAASSPGDLPDAFWDGLLDPLRFFGTVTR